MSSYFPPEQNLAIFDPSVFKKTSDALTTQEADTRYCRFPTAQGTMNFTNMNVFGDASFNLDVSVAGTLTAGTMSFTNLAVNSLDVGSGGINCSGNINMNNRDITDVRDFTVNEISQFLGEATFTSFVDFNQQITSLGTSSLLGPTILGSTLQAVGTSTFANTVILNSSNQLNRQFTTSYVNFSRTNNTNFQNADCRIFSLGGGENMFIQQITGTNISFSFLLPTAKTALTITPDELIGFANITVQGDNRSLRFISTNGLTFFRISQSQIPNNRLNFNTTNVNGDYLFNSFDGTSATPLLLLSNTTNTSSVNFTIESNRNLIMNSGTGRIVQAIPTTEVSDGESNLLKKTIISSNFPGATNNSFTNEIFDVTSGRGVRFVCNAGAGGYSPSTLAGDTVVLSRFRPPATPSVGFVFTLPSGTANIRIGSSDVGRGTVRMQAVNNQIDIDDDATQPDFAVSVVGSIRMTSTNALKRRINNVGRFSMFDIAGTEPTATGTLFVNNLEGVIYQSGTQASRGHAFFATNGISELVRKFEIKNEKVSVVNTTFIIESETPTTNIKINSNVDGSNSVLFDNNTSLNSSASFKCKNSSGSEINVISLSSDGVTIQKPLFTPNSTGGNMTQTGFTDFISPGPTSISPLVGLRTLTTREATVVGTYQLIASVALINTSATESITFSGTGGTLGYGSVSNSFNSFPSSLVLDPDFVLLPLKTKRMQVVMIDRNTTGAKTYFLLIDANYSSGGGNILSTTCTLTIAKIY